MQIKRSAPGPLHGSPWLIAVVGLVALAVAMGIGRFAFTPMMPLMLRDGTITATGAAEWATANYGGYLVGALTASWFASHPQRGLCLGLVGVAATTLAMAWIGELLGQNAGTLLRATAGVLSAWVLVCASIWCLAELESRQAARLGGLIYTGVGGGIAVTGVMTWLGGRQTAHVLWLELGALALVGSLFVGYCVQGRSSASTNRRSTNDSAPAQSLKGNMSLVLCYGVFGFGYIVPATFLPTMARSQVSDPLVFGLTWPIFGLAAVLSVVAASRWLSVWARRRVWAVAQAAMALGTLLPLFSQAMWSLAASAVLVGGTFMVITMAGMQLARGHNPAQAARLVSRMTAGFAVGQIVGPLLVRLLGPGQIAGWHALNWASAAATALLAASAAWLWHGEGSHTGGALTTPTTPLRPVDLAQ